MIEGYVYNFDPNETLSCQYLLGSQQKMKDGMLHMIQCHDSACLQFSSSSSGVFSGYSSFLPAFVSKCFSPKNKAEINAI